MKLPRWICGVILASVSSTAALAQTDEPLPAELLVGGGVLNVLQDDSIKQWMGVVEYRFSEVKWNIRPWVGIAHADEGTTFASVGLLYTLAFSNGLRFSAGWAPSYYDPQGGGRDLGNSFNFYSFGEAGYAFKNDHVVSVRFGHLSNGGLADRNPGTETLQLSYSIPLSKRR